ncbi:DUF6377 domain-containing protein [Sphingobacterium tabacisoli]|uniref:DUF6377 domain-containing protein n=1 Tax=Sphingobacterium tabacisoli TaxID=2044855 RepID=A0ABW5L0X6_9SPHI|nr:DUF6377 domain-containing protein [Sphingobacterium tabacisoli]
MKANLIFTVIFFLFGTLMPTAQIKMSYDESFELLEKVLSKRGDYFNAKLDQIEQAKKKLQAVSNAKEEFDFCHELFDMYFDLQIDSALMYAQQMFLLSEDKLSSNISYKAQSTVLIARCYAFTGMYKESQDLLNQDLFTRTDLDDEIRRLYYVTQMELHKGLAEHTIVEGEFNSYIKKIEADVDSLLVYTPKTSIWHSVYLSNKLRSSQQYDKALEVLLAVYEKLTTDERDMAIVAFYIANLYNLKGDTESEKLYLAISAITDVKFAVKEYVSLWKLGGLLYEEGEIDIAHKFVEISLQDAIYSGAFRWMQQITQVLPNIYDAYNNKILQQRNAMIVGFSVIACLLLGITIQYRRLRKTRNQLHHLNNDLIIANRDLNSVSESLHLSNAELQIANSQLVFLNSELVKIGLLKETYLSKFIDLCSDYIDKLDDYRTNLKRLFKGGKIEKLQKELDSKVHVEREHKSFLTNFDETFLKLYPNFIDEFNNLFPQEEKQLIKNNDLLTTELRIYALIRLGITDNNKIARFLRCSITTVYTYRSKNKNRSSHPDLFEDTIRDLQKKPYSLCNIK